VDSVTVRNHSRGGLRVLRARWCASFLCKLAGLSLRRSLADDVGLILVEGREGRLATSIHMFGMFFDIGVLWVNRDGVVVDARHARPWRLYFPSSPAQYTIEGSPQVLESAAVGDRLEFVRNAADS
jgi:uncharacterized membrane protein (UPF0127 family)